MIGSGPGDQTATVIVAELGRRVCVVDSRTMVDGVCVNTGPVPSTTLRAVVPYFTGMQMRDLHRAGC